MKKILLAAGILLGVVILPSLAMAHWADDNFDDGILNTNLWESIADNDPLNLAMLVEQNGRLEWLSGYDSDIGAQRNYASKWSLALSNDFELSFMGNVNVMSGTSLGLQFGLLGEPLGVNPLWQGRLWDTAGADVLMSFSYNTREDMFTFSNSISGMTGQAGGLRGGGNDYLRIYLGGYGGSLFGGTGYFDNFQITEGTVTPEPLSCALFLFGGGAIFVSKRFRRKA